MFGQPFGSNYTDLQNHYKRCNKPVRFGEDDVNQLVEIFKTFKQNN